MSWSIGAEYYGHRWKVLLVFLIGGYVAGAWIWFTWVDPSPTPPRPYQAGSGQIEEIDPEEPARGDPEGEFATPMPGAEVVSGQVRAEADDGSVKKPAAKVDVKGAQGGSGLIHPAESRFVHSGIVVDSTSREPVPVVSVRFSQAGRSAIAVTKGDGRYTIELEALDAPVAVSVVDRGVTLMRRIGETWSVGTCDVSTIEVDVGPTLHFGGGLPARAEVRILERNRPVDAAGVFEVDRSGNLYPLGHLDSPSSSIPVDWAKAGDAVLSMGDRAWPWIPLRQGERSWARYTKQIHLPGTCEATVVQVRDSSGGSWWEGVVDATVGVQVVESLQLSEDRFCSIRGRVVGGERECGVLAIVSQGGRPVVWEQRRPDSAGRFEFATTPVGAIRVVAFGASSSVAEASFVAEPGTHDIGDLILRADQRAPLRVHLTGSDKRDVSLIYSRAEPVRLTPFARKWFIIEGWPGEHAGDLADEHRVPQGPVLHGYMSPDLPPCWREYTTESTGESNVRLLKYVSPGSRQSFGFDVRGENGKPIDDYFVRFGPGGNFAARARCSSGVSWDFPLGTELAWMIWAPGYAPTTGYSTVSANRVESVDVKKGWGAVLLFRVGDPNEIAEDPWPWEDYSFPAALALLAREAAAPLPGVSVEGPHCSQAVSDTQGLLPLVCGTIPARIVVRCRGWQVAGIMPAWNSRVSSDSSQIVTYVVWMQRMRGY